MNTYITIFLSFIIATVGCNLKARIESNPQDFRNQYITQDLDSLLATYTSKPVYYVDYGNRECLFEIRVNDMFIEKLTQPGTIGGTTSNINQCIFSSGKQKIKVILRPFPGEKVIKNKEPFHLQVGYKDFAINITENETRPWNVVFTLPPIEVPEEGLPYIELDGEFEAEVPYSITGNSDCIDLRDIPDIEQRVVEEFKKVRQLMVERKFEKLHAYFAYKNNQLDITFYRTNQNAKYKWIYYCNDISEGLPEEFLPIENYELEFQNEGRSVTLRSKKDGWIESALLWIKQEKGSSEYEYCYFNLYLGIREGTNELVAVPA